MAVALRWLAAALLLASSFAHSFGGWPPLAAALGAAGVDPGTTGALQIGWFWGSAAFLAFSLLVVAAAQARPEQEPLARRMLLTLGALFVLFGGAAIIGRGGNPHFLLFVFLGLLLLGSAAARD